MTSASTFDLSRVDVMPFAQHLGMRVASAEAGAVAIELEVTSVHLNTRGIMHGGVLPALIDVAGTCSLGTLGGGRSVTTLELQVSFVAPCLAGTTLRAIGRVEYLGERTGYAVVTVTDPDGTTVGLGRLTCALRSREG